MSTDEDKPIASQVTKPSSQPTSSGGAVKITSQNTPQSQSQSGSGIVRAQGGVVMVPLPLRNLASQATKGGVSSIDGGG